jgi:hypothetical protein
MDLRPVRKHLCLYSTSTQHVHQTDNLGCITHFAIGVTHCSMNPCSELLRASSVHQLWKPSFVYATEAYHACSSLNLFSTLIAEYNLKHWI